MSAQVYIELDNVQSFSIHPNHPRADCKFTLLIDSRFVNSRWLSSGTYYPDLEAACIAARDLLDKTGESVIVVPFVNTHPLYAS